MSRFRDLKLQKKQFIGFCAILLIMAGVNIYSIRQMASMKDSIDDVSTNWLPRAIALSDILIYTSELRINQLQHASTSDSVVKQDQAQKLITLIDDINASLDVYEQLTNSADGRAQYSSMEQQLYLEFNQKWEEYQNYSFSFFMLSRENKEQEAIELLNGPAFVVFDSFRSILQQLVDVNKQDASAAAHCADQTFRTSRSLQNFLFIISIVISIIFTALLVRFITVPIRELEGAAELVADGNLSVHLDYTSKDEIGGLARSFNRMTASLNEANRHMQEQAEKLRVKNEHLSQTLIELRNTKEQLMVKEKMAALGDLVAGIAHEINTPIGTMLSSIDVVQRCVSRIEGLIDSQNSLSDIRQGKQFPQYLALIQSNINNTAQAGERITTIIKSLKNFARLDESDYQCVDIHDGLDSTLTLLENEMRGRITVEKHYGELPTILCNPGQINQVFINVLRNATQSIKGAGTITIQTMHGQNYIMIRLTDTGVGIPKDRLQHLFDFAFSVRNERIKLGSGLATSYAIIQQHDGEIEVESVERKGTTFTIYLPIRQEAGV